MAGGAGDMVLIELNQKAYDTLGEEGLIKLEYTDEKGVMIRIVDIPEPEQSEHDPEQGDVRGVE